MTLDRAGMLPRLAIRSALLCGAMAPLPALANDAAPDQMDALKHMSFEELMNVEITSVSRTEESLQDAAAAVAVVTPEAIRRSGATTLPDALRLVPGLHVGEQSSSTWAVSARGFSSISSEKLLVLSDTRSIYTPLFSGVNWDVQDYLLHDIERVEVIRGPGAALWGSNAVNGVINITTLSAKDTHGAYVEAGAGTFDRAYLEGRYGDETDGGVNWRVYGKYQDRDSTDAPTNPNDDSWRLGHVGFRTDWDHTPHDSFTVQGDAYGGEFGQLTPAITIIGRPGPPPPLEVDASGGNVLARWRHTGDDGSDTQLRTYYDYTRRDDPSFLDTLHTVDIDLQRRTSYQRQELLWGVAYRVTSNSNEGHGIFALDPPQSTDQLFSGFIQDQIALGKSVRLTLGTKLEHNDFSGFEVQPSVRAAWTLSDQHTLWSSVSRAVRVPTRVERDVSFAVSDPNANPVARLEGNDDFASETLIAYEMGDRWQPLGNLSFDLALFYNDYDRLASLEIQPPYIDGSGRTIYPVIDQNLTDGHTYGGELLTEWQPLEAWRLTLSYSYIDMDLNAHGQDANRGAWQEGSTPRNIAGLRSLLTLGALELDAQLRYQSRIRLQPNDLTRQPIDGFTELDLHFGWHATEQCDLSLVGQNLLHDQHLEFGPPDGRGALQRSVYVRAAWHN